MSIWDALEKAAYTGLGLAALTKEKLDEAVDTLKRERGLTEEEGRKLASELKEEASTAKKKLDERVDAAVNKALGKMHIATRDDIAEILQRLDALENASSGKADSD